MLVLDVDRAVSWLMRWPYLGQPVEFVGGKFIVRPRTVEQLAP